MKSEQDGDRLESQGGKILKKLSKPPRKWGRTMLNEAKTDGKGTPICWSRTLQIKIGL